jgi:class 3 adenylate cyclase/tetratricopeptide (TPR) repeat protein
VTETSTAGIACAECGLGLPAAARFCPSCGTPTSPSTGRETRRTVTLLFTDVTGSTAMGEQLDPEAYRGVMGRYFAIARAAIERHGGTVEKFVGDAVLAVFGIPEIHEDDALRAVRAAHELNDAVTELSGRLLAELGVRLAIRTGVNTGAVVAGSARSGGSFATGDAVNTAARLEQAAGDGEILLGSTTYSLVRDAVDAEAVEPVRAKGKAEPVPAYRLKAMLDADRGRRGRDDVPMVGRGRESALLDGAFEQALASGRSHLVSVIGPPGIGKSRLTSEFLAGVGGRARVARGRCLSYGQGITWWPLVQALRDVLDLSGTESAEITRHALTDALDPARDRNEVVESLLSLLGKGGPPLGSDQTFWCVRRLIEELGSQRPLVLSLDDLHWAEPALLELVQRMRDELAHRPLLLLCQARPELLEHHPGWGSEAVGSTMVRLDPLSVHDTRLSVAALLGGEPPQGLARAVADWSGGNPLFIEEIVTHLVDSGVLEHEPPDRWIVTRPLERAEPPPTVTALLTSRLDRLPPDERDLLERVSVIGLEFETTQAEMLLEQRSGPALADLMSSLSRRDLLRAVPSTQETWAFKHVLVRDAAYDGMAKALRSQLHERFADAMTAGADGDDGLAGFVAHHLEQAAHYRREVAGQDPETEGLVERALEALVLAADEARDREREDTAVSYLDRAMALRPAAATARRDILARRVVSCFEAGLMSLLGEALEAFETELDDAATDPELVFLRTMRGIHDMSVAGDADPTVVCASAQELVALGRATGDAEWIVRGLRAQSLCSAELALWRDAEAISEEVVRIGSPADARNARALHLVALALGDGTFHEWRDLLLQEDARYGHTQTSDLNGLLADAIVAGADGSPETTDLIAVAAALIEERYAAGAITTATFPLLADAFIMNRDLDGAIAYLQRVNDGFRRSGHLGHASTYILLQSLLMLERGDHAATVVALVEEAADYTSPYDRLSVAYLTSCRAVLAARSGDLERAAELVAEAVAEVDATQEVWHRADLRRWLSEVPRAAGDVDMEHRLLSEAAEMYARKEIRSYDAEIAARLAELDAAAP